MTQKYYFIAIGGVGMSGLAKYLLENGCEVSGSDICDSKYIDKLKELGATVHIGQKAENVPADAIVVASTAIRQDNPEMLRAKELGLTVYHRSDILAEISKWGKFFLGYSGTHGKTTTSGLCSYVLEKAGLKPSYVVGGIIPEIGCNAHSQDGKFFAAELDESDGTIVKYCPNICVVNNLEADHLDFYKDGLQSILETFEKFISNMPESSVVLVNKDCEAAMKLHGHKTITFGLSDADYTAKNIQFCTEFTTFDIYYKEEFLTDLKIILRGKHNVYNALSVLASLHQAGVDVNAVKPHFSTFSGMGRRFQKVGEFGGVTVYDDYAHHPTEIKAALAAAKKVQHRTTWCVFQPHTYSRTKFLFDAFGEAFTDADEVIIADIYAARESDDGTISAAMLADRIAKTGKSARYVGDFDAIRSYLEKNCKAGDLLLTVGAGDVFKIGEAFLEN